ncbi:CaiB/BaiF CoA transferase family protein [Mycobacterium kyogaense]|uniref:CaiB/BaiF CoA transferase family protein n=1 Tax=Mycobacterium kyogaense TaxID=2212479 RepID=UPI000DAD3011|nr:CoA transferase [Mycobacterium kyogaense]
MGVLDGVKVVELGAWVAGPSAGALLADWGAEVWKVEAPKGDPFRALMTSQGYSSEIPNAPFIADNRGKRSVALDLTTEDGRSAMEYMLAAADVFVTNTRTKSLARLDLTPEAVSQRYPGLVVALITGYGSTGPERDRAGYDIGAFGGRTGVLHQMRAGDGPPTPTPTGFGDHFVGLAMMSGVLGALLERTRTGRGQIVETSLLRTGTFALTWELSIQLMRGRVPRGMDRESIKNPLVNCYRAADDAWFWLLGVEADRHLPGLLRAIGREDLAQDERFVDTRSRRHNSREFIRELDMAFGGEPMSFWREKFDENGVWWAPVSTPEDVVADEQAMAAGCFVDVAQQDYRTVASPVEFRGHQLSTVQPAPDLGRDTESVLHRVGCPSDIVDGVLAARRR